MIAATAEDQEATRTSPSPALPQRGPRRAEQSRRRIQSPPRPRSRKDRHTRRRSRRLSRCAFPLFVGDLPGQLLATVPRLPAPDPGAGQCRAPVCGLHHDEEAGTRPAHPRFARSTSVRLRRRADDRLRVSEEEQTYRSARRRSRLPPPGQDQLLLNDRAHVRSRRRRSRHLRSPPRSGTGRAGTSSFSRLRRAYAGRAGSVKPTAHLSPPSSSSARERLCPA